MSGEGSRRGERCLLYGPGVTRGGEDDACVLVSDMVKVTRVLAVTALDVCRCEPAELRSTASRRR